MEATTRRNPVGAVIRAAGRQPGWASALGLALLLAGAWGWWATQLWGLPDIGDPFDVAAVEAEPMPAEGRNAFIPYSEAAAAHERTRKSHRTRHPAAPPFAAVRAPQEWAKADQNWRDLVVDDREALDLLRVGSERPEARNLYPQGKGFGTLLNVNQSLAQLSTVAALEGSRLESEGDLAGAWGWYRAILKASRHGGRHGFLVERGIGAGMHWTASEALTRWASDPRVDAPLLRRALDEVIAIDGGTVPLSEVFKMEYLILRNSMNDPDLIDDLLLDRQKDERADWCDDLPVSRGAKQPIQAARLALADDRERSLRVARLMLANRLPEVDKPPARRAALAHREPPIYRPGPDAPASLNPLTPEQLASWLESSILARRIDEFLAKFSRPIDRERARQARLVVHLATELYRREHGEGPPSPEALVGPYLKALPEWFGPDQAR